MFSYYSSILHRTPMRQATLANPAAHSAILSMYYGWIKIPRLIKLQNKAYERLFLKYINYIFSVLDIHFVIIDHPTM